MEPFPLFGASFSFSGGIALDSLLFLLLLHIIPTQRSPTRHKPATMTPTTIPAMAPEARLVDGLKASGLLDGLDAGKDEDVVSNALDQQLGM